MYREPCFFHGEYNGNIFVIIQGLQDGPERRERRPDGLQQEKLMVFIMFQL